MIQKSSILPNYECIKSHLFGMSVTLQSNNNIYLIPSNIANSPIIRKLPIAAGKSANAYQSSDISSQDENNHCNCLDSSTILYASAALGVIHNLSTNKQTFFDQHTDDITAITISMDGKLAATGCCGKYPIIHLWSTIANPMTGN